MQATPTLWQSADADGGRARVSTASRMLVGGEALSGELAAHAAPARRQRSTNLYGPTETTIWSAQLMT